MQPLKFLSLLLALGLLTAPVAARADIQVLSAGAVESAITDAVRAYTAATGLKVNVAVATGPEILRRIGAGESADIVIAPEAGMDQLIKMSAADGARRLALGRVGVGVAVRDGSPLPDLSTPEALKRAVMAADRVVYNQASTGLYVDGLLKRLQVDVSAKTVRYGDGNGVMGHIRQGAGAEIGFGAMTEILMYRGKGVTLAGPLPDAIQNYTAYAAAPLIKGAYPEDARRFLDFLAGPGRESFKMAGVF
jgi:molybdate transport system substrate-binding protein